MTFIATIFFLLAVLGYFLKVSERDVNFSLGAALFFALLAILEVLKQIRDKKS